MASEIWLAVLLLLLALAGFVAGINWIRTGWIELGSVNFYRWMIWELILFGAMTWATKRCEEQKRLNNHS